MNNFNKKKWLIGIIGVLIFLFLGHLAGQYLTEIDKQKEAQRIEREIQQVETAYKKGIEEIKKSQYDKAEITLSCFAKGDYNSNEKYKDAQMLYLYATARYDEHRPGINYRMQYQMANDHLSKIPVDYNGQFAKDIKIYKQDVKDRLEVYAQTDKEHAKERETKIYIGDSDAKVLQVFGTPNRKNRTVTGNVVHEQWVYGNGHYIYIENGIVTSFQD